MPLQRLRVPITTAILSLALASVSASKIIFEEDHDFDDELPRFSILEDHPYDYDTPKVTTETQEDIDKTCKCYTGYHSECFVRLQMYGAYIVNGDCMGHTTRQKRQRSDVEDDGFPMSPPVFYPENSCASTSPIIFSSSGREDRLTIGKAPFLLICRNSIGPHLKAFTVKGVSKVIISEGALAPRDSSISITFSDIGESMSFSEGAFSVQMAERKDGPGPPSPISSSRRLLEFDMIHPPIKIELKANNLQNLELKSRSVVAPWLSVEVRDAQTVTLGPNAIIPYAHPDASSLTITKTSSVLMEKEAVTLGHLRVTHTRRLLMNESAAEVGSDKRGEVILEHIANVTLGEEALKLSPGVSLTMNSVVITEAGRRAIHNANLTDGMLRKVELTGMSGTGLQGGALCLLAETAVAYEVALEVSGGEVAGCIQAKILHEVKGWSYDHAIVCESQTVSQNLCSSEKCRYCNPDPIATTFTTSTTVRPTTTVSTTTSASTMRGHPSTQSSLTTDPNMYFYFYDDEANQENDTGIVPGIASHGHWDNSTLETPPETPPSHTFHGISGIPLYLLIAGICAALLLCLLATYCIWSNHNSKKCDKYRLPQEGRVTTFHNKAPDARAIATSEPIFTLGKPPHPTGPPPRDMYISFQFFKPQAGNAIQETHIVGNGNSKPNPQELQEVPLRDEERSISDQESYKEEREQDDNGRDASLQANVSHDSDSGTERDTRQDSLMADDLPYEKENMYTEQEFTDQADPPPMYVEEDTASTSEEYYERSSKL